MSKNKVHTITGAEAVWDRSSWAAQACLIFALLISCVATAADQVVERTLVIPNGFEQLEGNSRFSTQMADTHGPGFRQQLIISHLQFSSVRGPIWITRVESRPDVQVTGSRSFTYRDAEWRLSTTEKTPDTLSIRFRENIGIDETLVYSGDWTLSTKGGPGLKDFDYVLEFDEPFYYDPSQGDLLLDLTCHGGFSGTPTDSSVMDAQWVSKQTHFSSVSSPDPDRSFGELTWENFTPIHRLTYYPAYSPERKSDLNGDESVDCADIQILLEHWNTHEGFCDIAPAPDGDGIVDKQDLIALVQTVDANAISVDPNEEGGCDRADTDAEHILVIPNGFDTLEGNSWREWKDSNPHGVRAQSLISPLQFRSLGQAVWITAVRERPDAQVIAPRQFTLYDHEVRLSTTSKTPETMSSEFASNIGLDERVVFSGDLISATAGRDGLEDFDYVLEFQRPFYYDPSRGALLMDVTIHGPCVGLPTFHDGQWVQPRSHFCSVICEDPDGGIGSFSDDWTTIAQFVYQPAFCPDLKGDLNDDEKVDCKDIYLLARHWGTADTVCDIAPEPLGDSVVDEQDLILLVTYMGMDCPLAHWKLDETEGGIAHDSIAAHDGLVFGDAAWAPAGGVVDGALSLDGVDDYVEVGSLIDAAAGPFSVYAWVKGGAPGQAIVSQLPGDLLGTTWLGLDAAGGLTTELMFPFPRLASDAVITDGQWHHVGLVWDPPHRYLYVDDREVAKDGIVVVGISCTDALRFGAGATLEAGSFFSGLIDDIRIYQEAVKP